MRARVCALFFLLVLQLHVCAVLYLHVAMVAWTLLLQTYLPTWDSHSILLNVCACALLLRAVCWCRRTTHDVPASWIWDSLAPGATLPFAWDDITAKHVVEVAAEVLAPGGRAADDGFLRSSRRNVYAFEIDTLQVRSTVAGRDRAHAQLLCGLSGLVQTNTFCNATGLWTLQMTSASAHCIAVQQRQKRTGVTFVVCA